MGHLFICDLILTWCRIGKICTYLCWFNIYSFIKACFNSFSCEFLLKYLTQIAAVLEVLLVLYLVETSWVCLTWQMLWYLDIKSALYWRKSIVKQLLWLLFCLGTLKRYSIVFSCWNGTYFKCDHDDETYIPKWLNHMVPRCINILSLSVRAFLDEINTWIDRQQIVFP